jgi:transposase
VEDLLKIITQIFPRYKTKVSQFSLIYEKDKLNAFQRLDGCYCLKSDVVELDKEIIHSRYKDLIKVENAFRTMKTEHLEIRPIHVRKKSSTDAHVLIAMLAYMITMELEKVWQATNCTVEQAMHKLATITYQEVTCLGAKNNQITDA